MNRGVSRATLVWVALALLGLVVAVSVSYAASQLSKPKVGLTSEPVSGLTELAPKSAPGQAHPPLSPAQTLARAHDHTDDHADDHARPGPSRVE